jgi:hypothetical protein
MEGAWDPTTGQTIQSHELSALLVAAGAAATNNPPPSNEPEKWARGGDILAVKLENVQSRTLLDHFYTHDKQEATSRICSFLARLGDQSTSVVVECGAMSAVVALHSNGHCYCASFVHRGLCSAHQQPACVIYSSCQMAEWSLRVATAFLGVATNERRCRSIMDLGEQRRRAAGGIGQEVPPTPLTPWLWSEDVAAVTAAPPTGVW